MPFFYLDYYYLILVVPALIFAVYSQIKVKSTYSKYSRIPNSRRMTGADAAMEVLRKNEIYDVDIKPTGGNLTDHYDPRDKTIYLSDGVYDGATVAAVGVACHEAGHAVQHAKGYAALKVRNAIIPVCNIGSNVGIPLIIIGFFIRSNFGGLLINVGLLLYALVAVFQLITLPVEFNASRRAISTIGQTNMLSEDESMGAKSVLQAAALTYVAAFAATLANLLRLFLLSNNRND